MNYELAMHTLVLCILQTAVVMDYQMPAIMGVRWLVNSNVPVAAGHTTNGGMNCPN
jgi:hypothetical protein